MKDGDNDSDTEFVMCEASVRRTRGNKRGKGNAVCFVNGEIVLKLYNSLS